MIITITILVWGEQILPTRYVGLIVLTTGYGTLNGGTPCFGGGGGQVLMVNLYQCYCKHYKMNGLCPMPHYEFQRRIAHVWLDKDYYSEKDKDNLSSSKSVSSGSTRNSSSSRRSRVSGDSLHPLNGNLKCRMNTSLCHWPCPAKGNIISSRCCQLHLWACGKCKYANCISCKDCNVNLCTDHRLGFGWGEGCSQSKIWDWFGRKW